MPEFRLENAEGVIKPNSSFLSHGTQSRKGNAVKTTDVKLTLEVMLADEHIKGVEYLFPDLDMYLKKVASIEWYKGEDRDSRTRIPEINVKVAYGNTTLLEQKNCPIKGKPKLKVNKDGEATLVLRPLVKVDDRELVAIAQHVESDVRISMEVEQIDLEHTGSGLGIRAIA